MAAPDAKYKKTEENKQKNAENPEAGDQAEIKGKKGMKKMLIAIAGLVVLIAGGLVFGLPYLKQATASAEQGTENKESGKSESSATSHEPVKATLALDPFLVNLADKEDVRFVKTTFKLGLARRCGIRS
jgi:flagellar basal body-associated protein FliL